MTANSEPNSKMGDALEKTGSLESEKKPPSTPVEWLLGGWPPPVPLVLVIVGLVLLITLFHIYTSWFGALEPYAQRFICITVLLILGFFLNPLGRKSWQDKLTPLFVVDLLCVLLLAAILIYVLSDYTGFINRGANSNTVDYILGNIYLALILELTRRTIGWALVIVAAFFLFQNALAPYLPGFLHGPAVPWRLVIELNFQQMTTGMFGMVGGVLTDVLVPFFIFIGFLMVSRGGEIFLNLAMAIAGRWTGGPAKVAIIASGLMGTMTGSSIANVVSTGAFTIPMMKKIGYQPKFASAVEAVASSGGQIMPPIMGTSAFLMVTFLGVSYWRIVVAAIIPAVLFYVAVFMMVHFESLKTGLRGLPTEQLPKLKGALSEAWVILVPIAALFYFIFMGQSLGRCALWATILLCITTAFKKETRLTPSKLALALEEGARMSVGLVGAIGAIGIIIASFYCSGLGPMLADVIVSAAGGQLWIGLIIGALVSIILGMAVPTAIVYVTVYLFAIPALVAMGANILAANLFAFYFGVISGITWPVAITAFTAARMADANLMRTSLTAMRIGIAAYIIPFLMVISPALVGEGPMIDSIHYLATGVIGVVCLSAGVTGWFLRRTNLMERVLLIAAAVTLIMPSIAAEVSGLGMLAFVVVLHKRLPYRERIRIWSRTEGLREG